MYTALTLVLLAFIPVQARAGDDAAAPGPGRAGEAPRLMVRLDATSHPLAGGVIAHVTPEGGETVDCTLNDSGTRPDATPSDGVWTGLALVGGDKAHVGVTAPDWTGDAGDVTLPGGRPRELGLSVVDGKLVLAPAAASGSAVDAGQAPAGERLRAGRGGDAEASDDVGGHGRRHQKSAPEPASNDLWYVAAAIGGISLIAVGLLWFRGPRRAAALPDGIRRLPDLGLFGPGTPPLVAGVSQWVVAGTDKADLVRDLTRAVAALRPVLVQAPDDLDVPGAQPGPGFRAAYAKAAELQDAAYDLQEVHPALAIVFVVPPAAGALAEWTAYIGKDFPVLAVVDEPAAGAGPVVRCARSGAGWTYTAVS